MKDFLLELLLAVLACGVIAAGQARAIDAPAWVEAHCSGSMDYHQLTADNFHSTLGGWRIDGYHEIVPFDMARPSPDGSWSAFWAELPGGKQTQIYCVFVGPSGVRYDR